MMNIVRFSRMCEKPMEIECANMATAIFLYMLIKDGYREDDLVLEMVNEHD